MPQASILFAFWLSVIEQDPTDAYAIQRAAYWARHLTKAN